MNRLFISLILLTAFPALSQQHALHGYDPTAAPLAKSDAEKKILAMLDDIVKSHHTFLSVPMVDGRAVRLLAEADDRSPCPQLA